MKRNRKNSILHSFHKTCCRSRSFHSPPPSTSYFLIVNIFNIFCCCAFLHQFIYQAVFAELVNVFFSAFIWGRFYSESVLHVTENASIWKDLKLLQSRVSLRQYTLLARVFDFIFSFLSLDKLKPRGTSSFQARTINLTWLNKYGVSLDLHF